MKKLPTLPKPKSLPTSHKRKPVRSNPKAPRQSSFLTHTYDPANERLDVTFSNGSTYRYHDVHPDHAAALASTDSKGSYLHKNIIGHHVHEKIA